MTEETHPIVGLTDEDLAALLKRAIRDTLILGLIPALVLLFHSAPLPAYRHHAADSGCD